MGFSNFYQLESLFPDACFTVTQTLLKIFKLNFDQQTDYFPTRESKTKIACLSI